MAVFAAGQAVVASSISQIFQRIVEVAPPYILDGIHDRVTVTFVIDVLDGDIDTGDEIG